MRGKLQSGCPDLPYTCDVCHRPRSLKVHARCSKIRQERHAQALRDEAFDTLLMRGGSEVKYFPAEPLAGEE